ncbi:MAG: HD domain-containing protein [Candidatus Daviesbacteria bacterium]|nr:HD domain-containing protein [Candidatus Daviesbacteria bacterium]
METPVDYSKIIERLDISIDPKFADEDLKVGLRYSTLSRWIKDNEIYGEALNYLPILRLSDVKSLSLLTAVDSFIPSRRITSFGHTRYAHSLEVALVSEEILKRSDLPKAEVKKGIVAGLIHDIATPALGNPVMDIDPVNLNEEDHWLEVVDNERGNSFFNRHKLAKSELDAIIHNKGHLGKVLDIADRIVYVGDDAHALFGQVKYYQESREVDKHLEGIYMLLREDPEVCDVYQDVCVNLEKGEVSFQDPERLYRFLKLRALLTKKIYQHPLNQARDRLASILITPFYTAERNASSDKLTPARLRRMTDNDLIAYLNKVYMGSINYLLNDVSFSFVDTSLWPARFQEFTSLKDAGKFMNEVHQQKNLVALGDIKVVNGFNTATSYLVKEGAGKTRPYFLVDPQGAEEIGEIEKSSHGIYVLYVNLEEHSPINEILKRKREMFGGYPNLI